MKRCIFLLLVIVSTLSCAKNKDEKRLKNCKKYLLKRATLDIKLHNALKKVKKNIKEGKNTYIISRKISKISKRRDKFNDKLNKCSDDGTISLITSEDYENAMEEAKKKTSKD
jgi:hypothetical protein